MSFPIPTRRLALVAVALSVPVLLVPLSLASSLAVVDGGLVALAVVDWLAATRPGSLAVERRLPAVVSLGAEAEVEWRVGNRTRRRLAVALADELAPSLGAGSRRGRLSVPPLSLGTASTTLRPTRRGRFEVGTLTVRVEGPLGLAARQETLARPAVLMVHPRYHSRDQAELRIKSARLLEVGLRSAQGRGGGTEFDALREYSVDDESRRIDWAATARTGRAIVRTYRAERNQTVVCLIDNGRTMAARAGGVPRVEHAMDATMMLTHVATRLGDRAGLLAFDQEVRTVVAPGHSQRQLARVTEAMYDLEPALVESDYRGAFSATLARFRRRSLLVLFTDLAEQALSETLLPALPLIVRHHLLVVAAVVDPDVLKWAASTPGSAPPTAMIGRGSVPSTAIIRRGSAPPTAMTCLDATGAYRKAAALAALDERRRVAARLQGLGATVVDAPPGELAPRLADAYLRVKATGRL